MFSIAADIRNTLGECPLWCERTRRLYWTDIEACELLALEEGNDAVMRWSLPERLGSFALTDRSHILLMGLASRLALYDLNTGFLTTLAASPGGTGDRLEQHRLTDLIQLACRTGQHGQQTFDTLGHSFYVGDVSKRVKAQ